MGVDRHVFDFEHLGDGSDAGDGFFGKLTDAVRKGAEELIADVDRAAAHARYNACVLRFGAVEPGEDHILPGTACAAQYAKDFNLHGLRLGTCKDRPGCGHQAAMNLAEGEEAATRGRGSRGRSGGLCRKGRREEGGQQGASEPSGQGSDWSRDCLKAGIHVYKIKPALHCSGRLRSNSVCHTQRF